MSAEPDDTLPPMNVALEDMLARAGYDADGRRMCLAAWIRLGIEYYAREFGRGEAIGAAESQTYWLKHAQPATPWKP